MKFLISNDDGVHALGLLALYQALSSIGEVSVVAPNNEQSGCASALSITTPLSKSAVKPRCSRAWM